MAVFNTVKPTRPTPAAWACSGTITNGGVDIAPFHDFEQQGPGELKAEIEAAQADIIAGDSMTGTAALPTRRRSKLEPTGRAWRITPAPRGGILS